MGIHALIFGMFAFGGVKVAGYSLAGTMLNNAFEEKASPLKIGFARTAIGIAGAMAYTALWSLFIGFEDPQSWHQLAFFLGLIFVRMIEWRITFRLFYSAPKRAFPTSLVLAGWSHLLDTPAWIAFRLVFQWWAITSWYAII